MVLNATESEWKSQYERHEWVNFKCPIESEWPDTPVPNLWHIEFPTGNSRVSGYFTNMHKFQQGSSFTQFIQESLWILSLPSTECLTDRVSSSDTKNITKISCLFMHKGQFKLGHKKHHQHKILISIYSWFFFINHLCFSSQGHH